MTRRGFTFVLLALGAYLGSYGLASAADAQSAIPRIGVLTPPVANSPLEEGLRDGLRELGYIDGKNIVIEWRPSAGTEDDVRSLVTKLARSKMDLIVVYTTLGVRTALEVTTMPVVFMAGDPVGAGFAASLARPGGKATGVSIVATELIVKRLELLRQITPRARQIVYLRNSSNPLAFSQLSEAQEAARTLGLQLLILDARNTVELDAALRAVPRSGADAVIVTSDVLFYANQAKISQAMRSARLPAIFSAKDWQNVGVLMSYGPRLREAAGRMAIYVNKILKGADPSELPIDQVSKYELVIDLRVARELGIKVPQDLLLRADEVIR